MEIFSFLDLKDVFETGVYMLSHTDSAKFLKWNHSRVYAIKSIYQLKSPEFYQFVYKVGYKYCDRIILYNNELRRYQ